MKCYRHQDLDAIGICKSCSKGVCPQCAALVDGSIACINACEDDVATLNYMIARGNKMYKNLDKQCRKSIIINGIGGMFFMGLGMYFSDRTMSSLLIGLGLIMLVISFVSFVQSRRLSEEDLN